MKSRFFLGALAAIPLVMSVPVHANEQVLGAVLGAGAGAVIGSSMGGHDGAVVGGALGAAVGATIAGSGRDRYVERVHYDAPPPRYYAPPPVVVYREPRPVYYGPSYVYVPPRVAYGPPPGYYRERGWRHRHWDDDRRDRDDWNDRRYDR